MQHKTRIPGAPLRATMLSLGILVLITNLIATGPVVALQGTRIIFLHHSCGQNLIEEGDVRQGLASLGYEFYDHGYNDEGLRLADGSYTGRDYDVPGDNTDPDGLAAIFQQPLHNPPDNTFSHLLQYDVIAFKSCYPTSNIGDDAQLAEFQAYYRAMRDRMAQHPDKLFVVVTQPPQVPGNTNRDEARRARALAEWLSSNDFLGSQPNIVTFDLFSYLAGDDDMLRQEYRYNRHDGHPNERANREIGPHFVAFLDQAIQAFLAGAPVPRDPTTITPAPDVAKPTATVPALKAADEGEMQERSVCPVAMILPLGLIATVHGYRQRHRHSI